MITKVKGLIREEKGSALVLTMILLLIGGLVMAPLLGYMGSGLIQGASFEQFTSDLYAADAGVEDTVLMVQRTPPSSYPHEYPIIVDGRSVEVEILDRVRVGVGCPIVYRYHIRSTVDADDGSPVTIESYISQLYYPMDFSGLLDYALSSDGTITIQPNSEVYGDIYIESLKDEDGKDNIDNKGWHEGEVKDSTQVEITWPTAEQLSAYYLRDVKDLDPYPNGIIDIKNTKNVGPIHREGALQVRNTGGSATLTLDGTLYIVGNLDFEQPGGNGAYTIDLNGQTIFVHGDIYFPPKFVSITGSGCIIAVGEVWFQPIMKSSADDFVFVMSIDGQVWFNPSGDFTGAIAGEAHVQLQPNNYLNWIEWRDKPLNFPTGDDEDEALLVPGAITTDFWEINPGA